MLNASPNVADTSAPIVEGVADLVAADEVPMMNGPT